MRSARSIRGGHDHDDGVRIGDRWLHAPGVSGRSPDQSAPRSRHACPAYRRVQWASTVRSTGGSPSRPRTCTRTVRTSSVGPTLAVSTGVETRALPDGRRVPVSVLLNETAARRFFLTNPKEYSLTYNGLVMLVEKRRSHGWQAFASYTVSKTTGLLPSSGTNAAGAQVSTVSPPNNVTFGRDPNDLTNAAGLLPNDRPHIFRLMGSVDVPRTGVVVAANLQYFTGKPWAATTLITLPQGDQRVQLESRGARRLSSQSLLDVRISRSMAFGKLARVELMLDVLNALNDTADEGLATDNQFSPNFGQPTVFVDPRRAMLSARRIWGGSASASKIHVIAASASTDCCRSAHVVHDRIDRALILWFCLDAVFEKAMKRTRNRC